jgi:hypothetical protein
MMHMDGVSPHVRTEKAVECVFSLYNTWFRPQIDRTTADGRTAISIKYLSVWAPHAHF